MHNDNFWPLEGIRFAVRRSIFVPVIVVYCCVVILICMMHVHCPHTHTQIIEVREFTSWCHCWLDKIETSSSLVINLCFSKITSSVMVYETWHALIRVPVKRPYEVGARSMQDSIFVPWNISFSRYIQQLESSTEEWTIKLNIDVYIFLWSIFSLRFSIACIKYFAIHV